MSDLLLIVFQAALILFGIPLLVYVVAKMWTYGSMKAKKEMEEQNGKRS